MRRKLNHGIDDLVRTSQTSDVREPYIEKVQSFRQRPITAACTLSEEKKTRNSGSTDQQERLRESDVGLDKNARDSLMSNTRAF